METKYIDFKLGPIIKQMISYQITPSLGATIPFKSYGTCISATCYTVGILGDGYCVDCWDGGKGRRIRNWDTNSKKEARKIKGREKTVITACSRSVPTRYKNSICSIGGHIRNIKEEKTLYDVEEMLDRLEDFIAEHGPQNKESLEEFVYDIGLDKYIEWKHIEIFIASLL